ncbi:DUF748 domain-containing protein [Algoriphagus halophytocola]|uniref:DUF748 domain-containing protein n=1 Tax=Algoriphagus halophytocola TaxID=2991499 RepID=A0ABY6MK36_9BACT|nr:MULTISPECIES: DUF748 domain-containing protein [unclassified Algoriphagus]UZD24143.1 DUF748 domain-containing protein [Algoriphagus sp. TR-M5]WBL41514.1 DUF748 domain-containing protein [Algoriphagus sp. TR-M9]
MKKFLWILGVIIIVGVAGTFALERYLAETLRSRINANADRQYDVLFEDIEIHLLRQSIEMREISLHPLKEGMSTSINGNMHSLELADVRMLKFLMGDVIEVGQLSMERPSFVLVHQDSVEKKPGNFSNAFQNLFGDLVSRGVIRNFSLRDGSAELFNQSDTLRKFGSFDGLSITAKNLTTDSALVNHAIPFKLESIETRMSNLEVNLNPEQTFRIEELVLDSKADAFDITGLSLRFEDSAVEASKRAEYQLDIIEVEVKNVRIERLNARSTVYGNWSIFAGLATIDSLVLHDVRNKNKQRPPDEPEKPMFEGMVEKIPFPLELDTVRLTNSLITYSEIPPGKSQPYDLNFERLSAEITNISSLDSLQHGEMLIYGEAVLNGFAQMSMDVTVPYTNDEFSLKGKVGSFNLQELNAIIGHISNVEITSGEVKNLEISMNANQYASSNSMRFDYSDLHLDLLDDAAQKKKLMSLVANILTSTDNLPEKGNYKRAEFQTERNKYRGVFNLIWNSVREGLLEIVPGDFAQLIMSEKDPPDDGKRR